MHTERRLNYRVAASVRLSAAVAITCFLAYPTVAAEPTRDEIVQLARDCVAANYAPVKTIQCTLVQKINVPPGLKEANKKNAGAVEIKPANPDGIGLVMHVRDELKWDATIAGDRERYDWEEFATVSRLLLRRGPVELDYGAGNFAQVRWHKLENLQDGPCDPREAMFFKRADTMASLLSGEVREAELIKEDGESVALITAKCSPVYRYTLVCPESMNYLPTQVRWTQDIESPKKGTTQRIVWIDYERHEVDGHTVYFPQRFYSSGGKQGVTSIEQLKRSKEPFLRVTNLELNAKLYDDTFAGPEIPETVRIMSNLGELAALPDDVREPAENFLNELSAAQKQIKKRAVPLSSLVGKRVPPLPKEGWIGGDRPDSIGKPYLIAFWATWSGPCKGDLPALRKLAADGATIVGMHPQGASRAAVAKYIERRQPGFPSLLDPDESSSSRTIAGYALPMLPYYIVTNAQGAVAGHGELPAMTTLLRTLNDATGARAK